MTPKQPTPRLRKSPEQVRSAVHQAVIDLLSDPEGADLTIPAIAQRAGVNHTSIYRRWGSREALLADVVVTRLERDWPLTDTGTLRGDLTAWAQAGVASIRTPEGRLLVRAVALSMPGSTQAQGERAQHFERRIHAIEHIRQRAAARGENPHPSNRSSTNSSHPSTYEQSSASNHQPPATPNSSSTDSSTTRQTRQRPEQTHPSSHRP
ncbi:TetR/AcrR family transcriptional regulator [Streptomyces sp. NBC_00879]|uniref:TetR/AcrR family transcriptional regulator n=1 Tax=Streptomyces sp. NBC_00879 TaxID=2975855 RepID=UPI00386AA666|nr:TetR/AcrR family transcriptional regulator [Streptomyces sp. NBC_00879]